MKIIFVGMHNKPGMTALDSKTLTGNVIDKIIDYFPAAECVKSNLCDIDYFPKDKKIIFVSNLEWNERYKPDENSVVVLLGGWVQKNFLLNQVKIVKLPHPAGVFGARNKEQYINNAVDKINNCCLL